MLSRENISCEERQNCFSLITIER